MKLKIAETAAIRLTGTVGKGFFLLLPIVIRKYAYLSYIAEAEDTGCVLTPSFREYTGNATMPEIEIVTTRDGDTTILHLEGRPTGIVRAFLWIYFAFLFFFMAIDLAVWIFAGLESPMLLIIPLCMVAFAYGLIRLFMQKYFRMIILAIEKGFPNKFSEHLREDH